MKIYIIFIISLLSINGYCQKRTILFKNQEILIYKKSATFKGHELYNAERDLTQLKEKEESDECKVDYIFYYNPLSLVDTYYSYESGEGGIMACGVPSSDLNIQTINLRTNKSVSLSDIFTKESILKALKEDNWIKKQAEELQLDLQSIDSFDILINTINTAIGVKFNSNSFAILDYDKKNKKASIRFVGREYMGFNHSQHLQLGLLLEPKQKFRKLLRTKIRFTIKDYKNGLYK